MGPTTGMRAVTIKEAKAHLNELVEAARVGESVVLMRGVKHVAAIVPISEADFELAPRLSDDQAARLWRSLAQEERAGRTRSFASAEAAVSHLASLGRRRRRRSRDRSARR